MSTVDERRAARDYDRAHPWQPMGTAPADGTQCQLRFADLVGEVAAAGRYVLLRNGDWLRSDVPSLPAMRRAVNWRAVPGARKLLPAELRAIGAADRKRNARRRAEFVDWMNRQLYG